MRPSRLARGRRAGAAGRFPELPLGLVEALRLEEPAALVVVARTGPGRRPRGIGSAMVSRVRASKRRRRLRRRASATCVTPALVAPAVVHAGRAGSTPPARRRLDLAAAEAAPLPLPGVEGRGVGGRLALREPRAGSAPSARSRASLCRGGRRGSAARRFRLRCTRERESVTSPELSSRMRRYCATEDVLASVERRARRPSRRGRHQLHQPRAPFEEPPTGRIDSTPITAHEIGVDLQTRAAHRRGGRTWAACSSTGSPSSGSACPSRIGEPKSACRARSSPRRPRSFVGIDLPCAGAAIRQRASAS